MSILLQFFLLVVGFVLLMKGADWFVDGASALADRLGIPQLVIGLTIVAMGTSLPEAAISITSSVKGSADIAVGNIIGSNILNILLILGLSSIITPLSVQKSTVRIEMPFMIAVTVVFALLGLVDGTLSRLDGVILWVLFLCYLGYLGWCSKHGPETPEEEETKQQEKMKPWKIVLFIILGGVMIVVGSDLTVDAASEIAAAFGMSQRLIGLTIVAFGTSLPELVTSVTAAVKKKADIAIGNIVGSNVFNILFVLGTSSLLTDVPYQRGFFIDSIMCLGVALLLWFCVMNRGRKLKRWSGILMLACCAAYECFIFLR